MGDPRRGSRERSQALSSLLLHYSESMRRLFSHIPAIAMLASLCLAGPLIAISTATAKAASPSVNNAALSKQVQEALAKQTGTAAGGQAASGAGQTSEGLSSGSLSNLTKEGGGEEEEAATPTTATTSSATSGGVSTSVLVPIFIVGAALLGGIAFFIVRDARSVAPAGDGLGGGGSSRDQAARLRKRRAKAKAARRQRKRNR